MIARVKVLGHYHMPSHLCFVCLCICDEKIQRVIKLGLQSGFR